MRYHEIQIRQHQAARLLARNFKNTNSSIIGSGLMLCRRCKWFHTTDPDNARIDVFEDKDGRYVAHMRDVATCGNAHLCPYCGLVLALHNSAWIEQVLVPAVEVSNKTMSLLTLTAFHQRESDWTGFAKNFFLALSTFYKNMRRDLAAIGFIGRYRGLESPVGPNGLHLHPHDLLVHEPGADLKAFYTIADRKWREALKKHGLRCNRHGVHLKEPGTFDPRYIAKEVASHDSKDKSDYGLRVLPELLSLAARGNEQAGKDWIRAAHALQGRDRWNIGMLANKLGIPAPSDWQPPVEPLMPVKSITYPQVHHMHATSPSNPRAGLAFILRAAAQEARSGKDGKTADMALRMCLETIHADIDELKHKHAHKLAEAIKKTNAATDGERQKLAARHLVYWMQDVADYKRETHARLFPAPAMLPLPPLWGPAPDVPDAPPPLVLEFGQELEFI
jgi:hypothetical protein